MKIMRDGRICYHRGDTRGAGDTLIRRNIGHSVKGSDERFYQKNHQRIRSRVERYRGTTVSLNRYRRSVSTSADVTHTSEILGELLGLGMPGPGDTSGTDCKTERPGLVGYHSLPSRLTKERRPSRGGWANLQPQKAPTRHRIFWLVGPQLFPRDLPSPAATTVFHFSREVQCGIERDCWPVALFSLIGTR